MQVIYISCYIITTSYKNFKMINLIHMISIFNLIFTIVLRDVVEEKNEFQNFKSKKPFHTCLSSHFISKVCDVEAKTGHKHGIAPTNSNPS
jgi:hypothetical protein